MEQQVRTSAGTRRVLVASGGALAFLVAGCSSSGGGGSAPTQSQIVAKLKSDSAVTSQLSASGLGNNSTLKNTVLTCIAGAISKDVPAGDQRAYVNGSKSLKSLSQTASDSKIEGDLTSCVTSKVSSSVPSATSTG